jgi:DUF2961 family protein
MSVLQNQDLWWGEGDDMFFVDGESKPSISGTGSEDYFPGAWDFGGTPFSTSLKATTLCCRWRNESRPCSPSEAQETPPSGGRTETGDLSLSQKNAPREAGHQNQLNPGGI